MRSRNLRNSTARCWAPGLMHDLAGGQVQRGEQVGDPVALVVMGAPLDLAGSHRQRRLGPVEGLDAGLLVDAHHHRMLGRVHVQPDDIADLVDELRVLRQLERVGQPRLQPERPPDPPHRRRRHPRPSLARSRVDQCVASVGLSSSVRTITASTSSSLIERGAPGRGSSGSPSRPRSMNRLRHFTTVAWLHPDLVGHLVVRQPVRGEQHDPRPLRDRMRRLRPLRPPHQHLPILVRHRQQRLRTTTTCHPSIVLRPARSTRAISDAGHLVVVTSIRERSDGRARRAGRRARAGRPGSPSMPGAHSISARAWPSSSSGPPPPAPRPVPRRAPSPPAPRATGSPSASRSHRAPAAWSWGPVERPMIPPGRRSPGPSPSTSTPVTFPSSVSGTP